MTYRGYNAAMEFGPAVGLDTFEHGRDEYFEEPDLEVQHRNLLLMQPNAKQGLTADELQMIDTFLAGGMKAEEVLTQNRRVVQSEK
eukprot:gene14516-biopygen6593